MLIKKASNIPSSEITSKNLYLSRRKWLAGATMTGAAAVGGVAFHNLLWPFEAVSANSKIDGIKPSPFSTSETITPAKDVETYNNYYEFSSDKDGPSSLARNFKTRPWKVTVEGVVPKKQVFDLDDIIKMAPPEERIY